MFDQLSEARDLAADARHQEGALIAETGVANDASRLGKLIETRSPEIDLPDPLIEIDSWTNFTDQLVPLSGNRSHSADMPRALRRSSASWSASMPASENGCTGSRGWPITSAGASNVRRSLFA